MLWVAGGDLLFKPPQWGGSTERAIEIYVRAADVAGAPQPDSPLPDWGKPEAIMALAYAHMIQKAPDLAAAEKEARAALCLQPQWSYVRDVLCPRSGRPRQIRERERSFPARRPARPRCLDSPGLSR